LCHLNMSIGSDDGILTFRSTDFTHVHWLFERLRQAINLA
jgi:hypothetical protein